MKVRIGDQGDVHAFERFLLQLGIFLGENLAWMEFEVAERGLDLRNAFLTHWSLVR